MVVATLATATPVNAAPASTYERNLGFFLGLIGEEDLRQGATFLDGRTMTLGEAIAVAASKAGSVDLAAIALGQAPEPGTHVGDIWIIETGNGDCAIANLAPQPLAASPDPQLYVYSGNVGTMVTSHGSLTLTIGWTDKTTSLTFGTAGFTLAGVNDDFCFNFGGTHFAFPYADGASRLN